MPLLTTTIRLDVELLARVKAVAQFEHRSVTSTINWLLERHAAEVEASPEFKTHQKKAARRTKEPA